MRDWCLVWQTEYENCEPVEVACRQIKYFAVVDPVSGETKFRRIAKNLRIFQVMVELEDEQHRLKLIENRGLTKFVWQHPERMVHPTMRIGLGKSGGRFIDSRRDVVDRLSPKCRVPGEKVEFTNKGDFVDHLNRVLGKELADLVMEVFNQRLQAAD
jgi:hypothetical protein